MRKSAPQQLNRLFKQGSLQKLKNRSSELNQINQAASQLFEQFGLTHVRMANIRNGVMVIEAGSAPWANRLKQLRQNILSELRKQLPSLVSIEIVINPEVNQASSTSSLPSKIEKNQDAAHHSKHHLSKKAAAHIIELAAHAPAGLKEKLLKLAAQADDTDSSDH